ncbi:MAG: phosphoglucomutase, partial [Olpidium bornovanus]
WLTIPFCSAEREPAGVLVFFLFLKGWFVFEINLFRRHVPLWPGHSPYQPQGIRVIFTDGSRLIFRLSGTGSSGATIRMYVEKYTSDPAIYAADPAEALKGIIEIGLRVSRLVEHTGRAEPTVKT